MSTQAISSIGVVDMSSVEAEGSSVQPRCTGDAYTGDDDGPIDKTLRIRILYKDLFETRLSNLSLSLRKGAHQVEDIKLWVSSRGR